MIATEHLRRIGDAWSTALLADESNEDTSSHRNKKKEQGKWLLRETTRKPFQTQLKNSYNVCSYTLSHQSCISSQLLIYWVIHTAAPPPHTHTSRADEKCVSGLHLAETGESGQAVTRLPSESSTERHGGWIMGVTLPSPKPESISNPRD